jgi:hypothetical protein
MDNLFDEKEIINVDTVFQQFFGKPAFGGSKTIYSPDSEVVEIDIMRGNERLAALIHRGTNSRFLNMMSNTEAQNFSSFSRVYPLAEELGDITASQINKRMGGEPQYDPKSRADRLRMLAREHHLEHIRRYVRLFEVLAGLSLLGGQQPAILNSANADNWYNFNRNAAHIVQPTVPWNDPAADILGDLDAAINLLRINGHVRPNVVFFGGNVANVVLSDTVIQRFADIKGYSLVRVGPENNPPSSLQALIDAGADPIGRITTPRGRTLWMFTYDAVFTDDAGNAEHYLPLNLCFLAYYGARCDRYFGPPERLEMDSMDIAWMVEKLGINPMMPLPDGTNIKSGSVVTPQMFYLDAYKSGDRKKVTVRTQSAPIFATTQTDAFFTYHHCLGGSES